MKVLVGLPSVTGLWRGDVWLNILSQLQRVPSEILLQTHRPIIKARNTICEYAIANNFTHVYMQDDDNTIDKSSLIKLIEHDKDIITVPIQYRNQDEYCCVFSKLDGILEKYEAIKAIDLKGKGLIKVDAVGFGAVLIKIEVLKELYKYNENPFLNIVKKIDDEDKTFVNVIGEDLSFCNNAVRHGFECWCDCSISSKHYGEPVEWIYNGTH